MLDFPSEWRFNESLGTMPHEAIGELVGLIEKVASQAKSSKGVYETFKTWFGNSGTSSSASWARSDMVDSMRRGNLNIPEFLDAYWSAMTEVGEELSIPPPEGINSILRRHGVGYAIRPPELVREVVTPIADGPQTASMVPTYSIGEKLGGGGYGEVFRASRTSAFGNFEFAIKFHRPSAFTDQERARQRFEREVAALRKLQHRAIVTYLDAGLDRDGRPYLVMPLVDGVNLRDASSGQEPRLAVAYMLEVLGGIVYAHNSEVLHRDLKPPNILVRKADNQPVIVDFGLAYILDDATQETLTTAGVGTPQYMPHEAMANPKFRSPGHDVFSCGVILYELIAGQLPDRANYLPLASRDPRLAPLDTVIRRALAPLGNRYDTAQRFRDELIMVARTL